MEEYQLYECIKGFSLPLWDSDNDCFYDNETKEVEKGSVWEVINGSSIIGGEAHLENVEDLSWIEISNDDLNAYFKDVTAENKEMKDEYMRSGY